MESFEYLIMINKLTSITLLTKNPVPNVLIFLFTYFWIKHESIDNIHSLLVSTVPQSVIYSSKYGGSGGANYAQSLAKDTLQALVYVVDDWYSNTAYISNWTSTAHKQCF